MARSRRIRSRWLPVFTVLLVCAQFTSLVGFPAVSKPSARTPCGGTACGCGTAANTHTPDCCCSTKLKPVLAAVEIETCCSLAKDDTKSCCAKPKAETEPVVVWVVGMFARGCHGHGPADWLAVEPAVPPVAAEAVAFAPPPAAAARPIDVKRISLASVPPDPPPRVVG